jgi:hypothetical protein
MKRHVRGAIARVSLKDHKIRGTAFLVTPDLCATALHVVANRHTDPPEFYSGEIILTFPTHVIEAKVEKWNAPADLALLRCTRSPECGPISLQELNSSGMQWESFGFPDAKRSGMAVAGTVRDANGTLEGSASGATSPVPVLQLYCMEAAAGNGMPVGGLSGAPVVIGDAAVGLLRYALIQELETPDGNRNRVAVAGTIYACKACTIVACQPGALRLIPAASPKGSISFAVVKGMTFQDVAELLGRHVGKNVRLHDFSQNERLAPLKEQHLTCENIREALSELGALAVGVTIREYEIIEKGQQVILQRLAS